MSDFSNSPKTVASQEPAVSTAVENIPLTQHENIPLTQHEREQVQRMILDRLLHEGGPAVGNPHNSPFEPRSTALDSPGVTSGTDQHAFRGGIGIQGATPQQVVVPPTATNGSVITEERPNWFTSSSPSTKAPSSQHSTPSAETGSEPAQVEKKAGADSKQTQSVDGNSPEALSERELINRLQKDISKALEAGLDKTTKIPSIKVTIDPKQLSNAEAFGSLTTQQSREKVDQSTRNSSPPSTPIEALNAERQHTLNDQHHRIEQLRVIQQMLSVEREQVPTIKTTQSAEPTRATNIQPELTPVALEKLRESFLDKLSTIQDQIQTSSSRREREQPAGPTADKNIQGRGDFITAAPIHHDAKPFLHLRPSDRGSDQAPGVLPFTKTATEAAFTSAPIFAANSLTSDRLSSTISALQRFARQSKNFQLIKQMDSALERTCLALVAGVAIGVLGAELAITSANMALRELLRMLCEDPDCDAQDTGEVASQMELNQTLAQYLNGENIDVSERGMVADISGVVVRRDTKESIPGVLVGSKELGSCITDLEGRFLFPNVKLALPYSMKFYKPGFALSPDEISGTCGFDSHHTVAVQLTKLNDDELDRLDPSREI